MGRLGREGFRFPRGASGTHFREEAQWAPMAMADLTFPKRFCSSPILDPVSERGFGRGIA